MHDKAGVAWQVGIVDTDSVVTTIVVRTPSLWSYPCFCRAAERCGLFLPPLPPGGWRLRVLEAIRDSRREAR
jgi:hypothetical protein